MGSIVCRCWECAASTFLLIPPSVSLLKPVVRPKTLKHLGANSCFCCGLESAILKVALERKTVLLHDFALERRNSVAATQGSHFVLYLQVHAADPNSHHSVFISSFLTMHFALGSPAQTYLSSPAPRDGKLHTEQSPSMGKYLPCTPDELCFLLLCKSPCDGIPHLRFFQQILRYFDHF